MTIYIQSPDVLSSNFMLPMARGGAASNGAGTTYARDARTKDGKYYGWYDTAGSLHQGPRPGSGTTPTGGTRKTYGSCSSPYQKYTCWDKNLGLAPGEGKWVAGHCPGKSNIQCYATGPPSGGGGGGRGRAPVDTTQADSSLVVDQSVGDRNKFVKNTLIYGSLFGATALGAWFIKKKLG